jgi:S-adenosylmethionine:tRNA ribosyltransferase-isomerase
MASLEHFDFELPPHLIAAEALNDRSASRMLVVDRRHPTYKDTRFGALPDLLRAGDVLVLNNTSVFPARLHGTSSTGAKIEIFLVKPTDSLEWEALARPAKRLAVGKQIIFDDRLYAEVIERRESGTVVLRFDPGEDTLDAAIDRVGRTPLPPYIHRDSKTLDEDRERYQTVYARHRGAIAAPTAGLHFTPEVIEQLNANDVETVEITLHVGYGTFEPIRAERLEDHRVQPERYEIDEQSADTLNKAKAEGRRIVAVGTTTTRTLEYNFNTHGRFMVGSGMADITILPGYSFRAIDGLLTNFHLPKSSLLVLVSTFAGRELIMDAYRHAIKESYRFYSYGDCMLIV